jgi:hypothetical protein
MGQQPSTVTIEVPDDEVGWIIGKQGTMLRQLQEITGCSIEVPRQPHPPSLAGSLLPPPPPGTMVRSVIISHSTPNGTRMTKELIENILITKRNEMASAAANPPPSLPTPGLPTNLSLPSALPIQQQYHHQHHQQPQQPGLVTIRIQVW